jgi:hypothetical protein
MVLSDRQVGGSKAVPCTGNPSEAVLIFDTHTPKYHRLWHTRRNGRLTPLLVPTARRWTLVHRKDVAGLRFAVEM